MSQDRSDDADVVPGDGSATEGSEAPASKATATRSRRSSAADSAVPTGKAGRGGEVATRTRRDADEAEDTRSKRANPIAYVRQVVEELRKVIWPGRSQWVTYTVIVFLFLIFISALVAGVDYGAGKLVELVFKK